MSVLLEMVGTVQRLLEKDVGAAESVSLKFFKYTRRCGSCYTPLLGDYFSVCFPVDDEGGRGGIWVKPGDETRFEQVHEVAHLFILFSVTCVTSRTSRGEIQWKRIGKTLYC